VLCHVRALLISAPEGRTDFIEADLRQPLAILSEAARTLDFGRPAMAIDAKAPGQMWAGVALKPAPKPAPKPALKP
jgi:S-adenosyl methyltransferase